jgi:hypothetical protein
MSMCPVCASSLVEINVSVVPDSAFVMRSCGGCERRSWWRDGRETDLEQVLQAVGEGARKR